MHMKGKIHHIVLEKRFFFIMGEDGIRRFAHADDLLFRVQVEDLKENDEVQFLHVDGNKGPRAAAVSCQRLTPTNPLDELFDRR